MEKSGKLAEIIFNVRADAEIGELVHVVGNCAELGNWDPDKAVPLKQDPKDKTSWSGIIQVNATDAVYYRYLTCIKLKENEIGKKLLQRWEGHKDPRTFQSAQTTHDVFGLIGEEHSINCGLATSQHFLILKFKQNSIRLWSNEMESSKLRLRASCIDFPKVNGVGIYCNQDLATSSFSTAIRTIVLTEMGKYDKQPAKYGEVFNPKEDFVMVMIQYLGSNRSVIQIDLFQEDVNNQSPSSVGFFHLLPEMTETPRDAFSAPVYSDTSVVGQMRVEILNIHPFIHPTISLEKSYACDWISNRSLIIGHRGSGACSGIRKCYPSVVENTIASFKLAHENKFDFVEFDVQLSQDMIPVIYHNYTIGLNVNGERDGQQIMEVNVMDLSLHQLHSYSFRDLAALKNLPSGYKLLPLHFKGDQKPFPTLLKVLNEVDLDLGFNIEIKAPLPHKDGTLEIENFWKDLNVFIDIILEVVLKNAKSRHIFFSCFDPDVCLMLKLKQNVYPVALLICGKSKRYTPYDDDRTTSIPNALNFALSANLQGLVPHADEILEDVSVVNRVHQSNLLIFTWGDSVNNKEALETLKNSHLDGIIHDRF